MKTTKLVVLLKSFTKNETVQFDEFINSPFFNKNKSLTALYTQILKFYPQFDSEKFTEEHIYKKIFPGEKFDYFKIKNTISDLLALAVRFLKISSFENKEIDSELALLNILHERKLDTLYAQREKKLSAGLNNAQIKDEDNLLRQYQLGRINAAHYKFEKSSYEFGQIQNEFDAFLQYSLTGLLRLYSKMIINSGHGNIRFNKEMFENVWEYAKDKNFENNPSCMIYRQIILLELSKNEEHYIKLESLKNEYSKNIPAEEHYYILLVQNAFAAYRLKLGDESYYPPRFLIFKEMFDNGFMDKNYIIFPNFISAYSSAIMAGEYEWADDLLPNAQKGVSPKEEVLNTIYYCKAFKAFTLGDYEKALEFFSKTNFKLYLMKVMVKSYSVRIYFELNLYEQALSAIDAFRHYLKTEKLMAEDQKTAHYEFMRLLTRFAELKIAGLNRKNPVDLELLRKQSEQMSSNPLGSKNWLIKKINEFEKV